MLLTSSTLSQRRKSPGTFDSLKEWWHLKGDIVFLSRRPPTSFYVTHPMRNCWIAYRQTWMLPWMSLRLQNVGNQLVTGDIRFTEGTMTSKGGSTFLSARQQILLYVTHHQRNCWAAYQQRWMLPWRHVHWQNVGNYAVKGDIRFTVRNTAFKGGRAFTVRDSSNLLVRYWQHKKLQPPLSRDMDVTWNVPVLTLQNVGSHPVTGSISSSSCSSFIFIDKTYRTEIYLNGSQQRRTTWA